MSISPPVDRYDRVFAGRRQDEGTAIPENRESHPMKTVYTRDHQLHRDQPELAGGKLLPGFELPARAEFIVERARAVGLGPVIEPAIHDLEPAKRVHASRYVDFLAEAWSMWVATGRTHAALPSFWRAPGMSTREPDSIDGKLGYFSFDAGCALVAGSWQAIRRSADTALSAAALVQAGERAAFALCRPPGHHAGTAFMGGYCYLNNAAIAAQAMRDGGARRVAVLDVDYHHGNGTQEIFYARPDVFVINLHGDPLTEYPFFLGHADERGVGAGEGFNINYPMPPGTNWSTWNDALEHACVRLASYNPDVVIVSLGVDTFEKDPISQFKLVIEDYPKIGRRIAALGLPTLFVMEGGYAVAEIGVNAVGVLTGFEDAA